MLPQLHQKFECSLTSLFIQAPAAAAPVEAPKPKVEEVDALDGGMDMFGGGGGDY
jgi:hypothetical protein